MNIFELDMVACPVAGAMAGGQGVRAPGAVPCALGVAVGLLAGLLTFAVAMGLSSLWFRWSGEAACASGTDRTRLQRVASLVGIAALIAAPYMAWFLARHVTGWIGL